ncbi:MAG TPA: hypothetical protein VGB53_09785 [Rubricoccaceae bacterium]
MSFLVEITEASLPRERQAALAQILIAELNVEPEEAELTALVMPALVGPFATAADRDAFLVALAEVGFAARAVADEAPTDALPPEPAYAAPTYAAASAPAAYAAPPIPVAPVAPPTYAAPPEAAPVSGSSGLAVAVAIVLGVIAAVLAVVVLTGRGGREETTVASDAPPGGYPSSGDADGDATPISDAPEAETPVLTDDAAFALGYSPRRGVNWDLFSAGTQTRYSGAPDGTPIPVRDAPSARNGTAVDDVPPGEAVTTDGCLRPRPEDGGRWCRTDYAGGEGWIYDRYLLASAPARRASAPSGGLQTVRLRDGQFSITLSEGGRTWRLPRSLSANTSVSNLQRTTLAGRDIVQFEARDGRWTTTYFWEYRQGLLHFVGQDGSGTVNVSEAPGSRAVVAAALGYVPGDDVVRGSGNASRAPTRNSTPRSGASAPNIIVMGSYQPYDQAGLDARYAQAQRTGLTLQVVPSETYGMTPGLRIIVAGPFDRDTALRLLPQVRQVVPDAFRNSLD